MSDEHNPEGNVDEDILKTSERDSIIMEAVFRLSGGELENGPLCIGEQRYRYWYEGVPDYVTSEFRHDRRSLKTVIACELFGPIQVPEGWSRVAAYQNSGECECLWCGDGTGNEDFRPDCTLCEGDGTLYIGDGWCEVVIAKKPVLHRPEDYFDGFGVREPFVFEDIRYVLAFVSSFTRAHPHASYTYASYTYHFVIPEDSWVDEDTYSDEDGLVWVQERAVNIKSLLQRLATHLNEHLDLPYGSEFVSPEA